MNSNIRMAVVKKDRSKIILVNLAYYTLPAYIISATDCNALVAI